MSDRAVILMAYGSPDRLEDVPAYYEDIRGGRPVRQELVDELVQRYERLGIGSPPFAAQRGDRGDPRRARTTARHPRLHGDEALASAHPRGGRACPRRRSHDTRRPRPRPALLAPLDRRLPPPPRRGARRPRPPGLRRQLARRPRPDRLPRWTRPRHRRTRRLHRPQPPRAHPRRGRPVRAGAAHDGAASSPSEARLERWSFSYQSESATGEPWLGPDILDHLQALHDDGVRKVLVCPIGFVADHLEIRWDLDVEAAEKARELGVELDRVDMPNADPAFVAILARLVAGALAQQPAPA